MLHAKRQHHLEGASEMPAGPKLSYRLRSVGINLSGAFLVDLCEAGS